MPTAHVNGQHIHYVDTGGGGPVLVFSHGFLMSHSMFDPQLAALSAEFRCIAWDERGHGQTTGDAVGFTYYDSAEDIVGVLGQLGIDRAVFVGMSQGGFLSLRLAAEHPEMVDGLVLLGSQAGVESPEVQAGYDALVEGWKRDGLTDDLVGALTAVILDPSWPGSADWVERWRSISADDLEYIYRCLADRDDVTDRLPEIASPVLVVWGTADGAMDEAGQQRLVAGLPDNEFVVVDGATHIVNLTHPDVVNAQITRFAHRVYAGASA